MRITSEELADSKIDLKAWTGALQRAGRAPGAPSFALSGPCTLDVRKRRTGATAVGSGRHAFIGGDLFTVSGVVVEEIGKSRSYLVSLMMMPASLELSKEVAGLTMKMEDAFANFDGLEAWALEHRGIVAPTAAPTSRTTKAAEAALAHEENPLCGSW